MPPGLRNCPNLAVNSQRRKTQTSMKSTQGEARKCRQPFLLRQSLLVSGAPTAANQRDHEAGGVAYVAPPLHQTQRAPQRTPPRARAAADAPLHRPAPPAPRASASPRTIPAPAPAPAPQAPAQAPGRVPQTATSPPTPRAPCPAARATTPGNARHRARSVAAPPPARHCHMCCRPTAPSQQICPARTAHSASNSPPPAGTRSAPSRAQEPTSLSCLCNNITSYSPVTATVTPVTLSSRLFSPLPTKGSRRERRDKGPGVRATCL